MAGPPELPADTRPTTVVPPEPSTPVRAKDPIVVTQPSTRRRELESYWVGRNTTLVATIASLWGLAGIGISS